MLKKIFSFFTNGFDIIGGWFQGIGRLFNYMATQRWFLISSLVVSVKALYDFTITSFNDATVHLNAATGGSSLVGDLSFPDLIAFANSIIPLSETFAGMVAVVEFWMACTFIKIILCFIPTIK